MKIYQFHSEIDFFFFDRSKWFNVQNICYIYLHIYYIILYYTILYYTHLLYTHIGNTQKCKYEEFSHWQFTDVKIVCQAKKGASWKGSTIGIDGLFVLLSSSDNLTKRLRHHKHGSVSNLNFTQVSSLTCWEFCQW